MRNRVVAVGDDHPDLGKGAPELVGGPLASRGCHPKPRSPALGAPPRGSGPAAPPARGNGSVVRGAQRPAAVRAACGMPARGAHEHGSVSRACDLNQHRAGRERITGRRERRRRDALTSPLPLARGAQHGLGHDTAGRCDVVEPPQRDESLDVRRAGVTGEQQRGALHLLSQQRRVAGVDTGTERLREQRVAVVPHDHGADGGGGGVDGGAVSDDDAGGIRQRPQIRPVPRRPALPRIQADEGAFGEPLAEHLLELRLITMIRHHEDRAPTGGERIDGDGREQESPHADVGRALRVGSGADTGRGEECPSAPFLDDRTQSGELGESRRGPFRGFRDDGHRCRRSGGEVRLLGAHHSARNRHLQHAARGTGRAIGGAPGERIQPRRQDRHGRDDILQVGQGSVAGLGIGDLDDPSLHRAARGPQRHLHPHPGERVVDERDGDRIVEQAVQLRQRGVDEHPRDAAGGHVRDRRRSGARRRDRCVPR